MVAEKGAACDTEVSLEFILTKKKELQKVFRDWCEVDLHNIYFYCFFYKNQRDQALRFLLDKCFKTIMQVRIEKATGEKREVADSVIAGVKSNPTQRFAYPEKGGFVITKEDEDDFENVKREEFIFQFKRAFVESEMKRHISSDEFLEAL